MGWIYKRRYNFFEDLDIGRLITSINQEELYEFSFRILKNIPTKDLISDKILINLYSKYNGSITKIADELFLHKNTIQYRLNRIKELTGYDPRAIKDFIVLWLAFISV